MHKGMIKTLAAVLLLAAAGSRTGRAAGDSDTSASIVPVQLLRAVVGRLEMTVGDDRDINANAHGNYDISGKRIEGTFVRNERVDWLSMGSVKIVRQAGDSATIKATRKGSGYVQASRKCYFKSDKPQETGWTGSSGGAKEGERASQLIEIWVIDVTKGDIWEEGGKMPAVPEKGGELPTIPRAVIEGKAVMVGTHEPVEGATVSFPGEPGGIVQGGDWLTGSGGDFSITVADQFWTGQFEVMVQKHSRETSIKGADGSPDPLTMVNDLWPVKKYVFSISPKRAAKGPIDVGIIELDLVSKIWGGKGPGRDTTAKVGTEPPPPTGGTGPGVTPPVVGGGNNGLPPPVSGGGTSGVGASGGGGSVGGVIGGVVSGGGGGGGGGVVGGVVGGGGGGGSDTSEPAGEGKGAGDGTDVSSPEGPGEEGVSEPGEETQERGGKTVKPGAGEEEPGTETEEPGEEPGDETTAPLPPPGGETQVVPPAPVPAGKKKPDIKIIEGEPKPPPPYKPADSEGWHVVDVSGGAVTSAAAGSSNAPVATPQSGGFRQVSSLSSNELNDLLGCLCRISSGAAIGTYSAYHPEPVKNQGAFCEDPGNGPCVAGTWGCWRAFIDFSAPDAMQCLASSGLNTNDPNAIWALDEYNRKVEKPLTVSATADRTEICRGEEVEITISAAGGRPPYYFRSLGDHASYEGPPTYGPEDRIKRFGGRELENLDRAVQEDIGKYKAWETIGDAHVGNVWKKENTFKIMAPHTTSAGYYWDVVVACLTPGPRDSKLKDESSCMAFNKVRILVLSDAECDWKDGKATAKPKPKTTTAATTSPKGGGSGYSSPPVVIESPVQASPSSGPSVSAPSGSGPATSGRPPEAPKPPKGATTSQPPSGGQVSPVPKGTGGEHPEKGSTTGSPVTTAGKSSVPPGTECSFGGGGTAIDNGPVNMWMEVPAGQRIRVTIKGSDGFTKTIEGVGRVDISRPRNPNGADAITMENLDVPGCSQQQVAQYDTNGIPMGEPGAGLEQAEPTMPGAGSESNGNLTGSSILDGFVNGHEDKGKKETASRFKTMGTATKGSQKETSSDMDLASAAHVIDTGGADAQDTKNNSAKDTAKTDQDNSWSKTLGDSVQKGFEDGVKATASAFGTAAADQASGAIFGGTKSDTGKKDEGESSSGQGTQVASGSTSSGSSGGSKGGSSGGSKGGNKGGSTGQSGACSSPCSTSPSPTPGGTTITCPACGATINLGPGESPPKWCPNCCAGPDSTECAHCGYRWCGRNGPPPSSCPRCGWHDAPEGAAGGVSAIPSAVPTVPPLAPAGGQEPGHVAGSGLNAVEPAHISR